MSTYERVALDLALAESYMRKGDEKMKANQYEGAFIDFQNAGRIAKEVNIYIRHEANLKADLSPLMLRIKDLDTDEKDGDLLDTLNGALLP